MGSNENESCNNYYLENTVFVAVSKHVKDSESVLSWAAKKFGGKKKICILYVHQPASLVSFFGGKLTVSKFQQRAINALREADIQKLHKLISQYVLQLSNMGVHADRMWIEMDNVEEGIVDMIVQHGIKWLVMGAAADKYYKKDMTELKSQKAIFVCEHAPVFCHIWFICRGNLISTRKGVDSSVTTEINANVANIGQERVYLDDIGENASREQQSIPSNIIDKDPEQVRVESHSDVSTDESESSALSDDIEEAKESEDERIDYMVDGHMSPPRLTFRERGPILRTCSIDFDSQMKHNLELLGPFEVSLSTERVAVEGKRQIIKSQSSSDLASFKGKMEGKARLQTLRDISSRLEQAISDTNNVKQLAFQESVQRWRAEEDAMDAKKKASAAEYKFAKVMKQRTDVEEDLARQKSEHIRYKEEHDKFRSELPIIQAECSDLEDQVGDSEIAAKELEEKIVSAVELLISFRKKRDQLEIERDNAIHNMESLKKLKEQRVAALSGPRFPTFSLIEIGEATCSFDPSKKIGDGTYGSIYQGMLGHMEVAIRMLPNDGIQAQLMFEHQVEILSRLRHPNIVAPIGICPEARSIVYEYLERGSLEDSLACRRRTRPLPWQTRVRIATELCSALIFLHTNNPPMFHGNLKPTKILLDANFVSKIGDLGIFHLILQNHRELLYGPNNQNRFSVYTDPEFLSTGVISPLSDVYSFGMIILHLITGAPGIVKDVKRSLQCGNLESILDFSAGDWPVNQVKSLARVALQCCDRNPSKRPDLGTKVRSVLQAFRNSCDAQISFRQNQENRRPPSHFLCPIYQEVMKDPCTAGDGYTYEGDAIRAWLDSGHTTSPMTNLELPTCDLVPNHALHYAIQEWLQRS
ncbi:U-box domain-containing protein 32-like [Silene latifolia]|uniref:U-box domain-containing protein 32-like n=1 Tax=Silene latifolia TaxID=37657 RepID=UPI003D783BE6